MKKPPIIFAVARRDIKGSDDSSVERHDVGIVESVSGENVVIFFVRVWKKVTVSTKDLSVFNVVRVGDEFPKKICNICHKLLPTREFAKNQNAKNNRSVRRPSCKTCRTNLEGVNLSPKIRSEWTQKKPKYAPFECPVCSKRTIAGVTCKIVLDHNHRTGEVRGWICDSCNTGIGRFKDDAELLKRAMSFLGYSFR